MKNKRLIIILIIILIILTLILAINHKEKTKIDTKNIKAITESFTITDIGTQIDVKIKNNNKKETKIKNIKATLYDTSNKKIKVLEYTKEIKIKKEKIIQITSNEKYPMTADIKYKISI